MQLKFEDIEFNSLVRSVIEELVPGDSPHNITFKFPEQNDNRVHTDYNHLKLILLNVINNSIKYHNLQQQYPYVKISFIRISGSVQIMIEDNGHGIPKQSLPKFFDMFYRANSNIAGTGLGLYIVSEALSRINGKISAESTFGKGSTFKITLLNA